MTTYDALFLYNLIREDWQKWNIHPTLRGAELVNCPTWWSLLFIFGFLCWSSVSHPRYKEIQYSAMLCRPTLHSIDRSQCRLYSAKCISDAGFSYLGPCRAHAHSLVIDQFFNIWLFYQLSFEAIGQSDSSSIFVCFMPYASRDSSVLLSETELQSQNH